MLDRVIAVDNDRLAIIHFSSPRINASLCYYMHQVTEGGRSYLYLAPASRFGRAGFIISAAQAKIIQLCIASSTVTRHPWNAYCMQIIQVILNIYIVWQVKWCSGLLGVTFAGHTPSLYRFIYSYENYKQHKQHMLES